MKTVMALLVLVLCSSAALAQPPLYPCGNRQCIYLTSGDSNSPVIQIEAMQSLGIGLLSLTQKGTAILGGATQERGVGVSAVGINGATALKVSGQIVKPHEERHLIKFYDPITHILVATFEYSFE